MGRLVDKAAVLALCICLTVSGSPAGAREIAWLVATIGLTSLISLVRAAHPQAARIGSIATACTLALAPGATAALPLATCETALSTRWRTQATWLCALVISCMARGTDPSLAATTACASILSALLARRGNDLGRTRDLLHVTEDELSDRLLALRARNRELEDARGEQERAATLAERTRIAREVHDGVGHHLTRLIYQVAALRLAHRDDARLAGELDGIRSGLDEAMHAMRASVHALDDHATDLHRELDKLAARSPQARVTVSYDLEGRPDATATRCLAAVTREALANAERHAHAHEVAIHVREFPGLWQLTIENDGDMPTTGTTIGKLSRQGLGLRSMRERVESLGGTFRTSFDAQRFQVFASIPRKADL